MDKRKQNTWLFCFSKMFVFRFCCYAVLRNFILAAFLFFIMPIEVSAQDMFTGETGTPAFNYDELPVTVYLEANLSFDIDVFLLGKDSMYVNVEELFKNLIIPCKASNSGNKLEGFIENENKPYEIDFDTKQIKVGNMIISPNQGLVKEMGSLYIESGLLANVFGIKMTFNRRSLDVKLQSAFELPVVKQMRLEKTRQNISKLRGEQIVADTLVKRNYHLFKLGTLDWSAASYQTWNEKTNNRFGLGLGTELLNGEANISAYYDDQYKFDKRQVNYLWRWIDNDKPLVKQAEAGKIFTQSIAFLNAPVVGASIKNTPNTLRKASGFYPVNGTTEPNWTVELYINDILVEYLKADASGLYLFNVPIVYGYTRLKLKFYGPLGEERTEERTINIPYTILPAKEMEYSLSAGVLQDASSSRFAKGELNYGISRTLTIGGGLEYLSSISTGAYIPYIKGTFHPFSKLTVNGEYAYGVRSRGLLSYYFGKNTLLELDYAKYAEGQKATLSNAPEERKIRLSVPIKIKSLNGYLKMEYRQFVYSEFTYNYGSIILSAFYKQFSANSSTTINWTNSDHPYITSDLALSFRFRKGFVFRPSVSYNVSNKSFLSVKAEVEKRFRFGYFNVAYEKNILYNQDYITAGLKFDLPFARINLSVSKNRGKILTSESAQGSMAFGGTNYTHLSNNSSLSKGGILLYPFLDVNQNGIFDKGEQMVKLNSVIISGGKAIFSEKDSIVRIPDLNAFTNYILEFKDDDLETISWRFKHKIYSILVDPNQFKRVDIPIISVGEVSGMTYIDKNNEMKGLGRIIIKFYDKSSNREVAQTLSESDGYVYYLGLEPGEYVACVDSAQLSNLGFTVDPPCREFTIKSNEDGDIISGLDFILRSANNEQSQSQNTKQEPIVGSRLIADSLAVLKVSTENAKVERQVTQEIETITYLSDEINLPVVPNNDDLMVERAVVTNGIINMDLLNEEDTLLLKPNPVQQIVQQKVITADIQKIDDLKDEISLPLKPNPVDFMVERAIKTTSLITTSHLNVEDTMALSNPVKSLEENNLISEEKVVPPADTISQVAKSSPLKLLKEKEVLIPDSEKNNLSETMHRIDQKAVTNKISKGFTPGDTLFKVQLLALPRPLKDKNYFNKLIAGVPDLTIEETLGEDGLYHYSTGTFKGMAEATKYQRLIRKSGWKDSFVAKYAGERRTETTFRRKLDKSGKNLDENIPVKRNPQGEQSKVAQETEIREKGLSIDPKGGQETAKPYSALHYGEKAFAEKEFLSGEPGDTLYKVQLLALRTPINIDTYFALLFSRMPGLKIEESHGDDGLYRYNTKPFASMQKARDFEQIIRNNGWIDCFIATYISGNRH